MPNPNDIVYSQRNATGTGFNEKTFVPIANTLVMVGPCLELTSYTGSFNSGSGGLTAGSASWASHSLTSETSDFALLAGEAINSTNAQTSDFALLAGDSINATSASFAISSSVAQFTNTASFTVASINAEASDFALLAGAALTATSASLATSASYVTASNIVGIVDSATSSSYAITSSYALIAPLTFVSSSILTSVTMSVNNTWYNGPSIRITEGTWMVETKAQFLRTSDGTSNILLRINDPNRTYFQAQEFYTSINPNSVAMSIGGLVTVTASLDLTASALTSAATWFLTRTTNLQPGPEATNIYAVKLH